MRLEKNMYKLDFNTPAKLHFTRIGGISMSGGSGRMLTGITLGVLTLSIIESGLNFAGASPYAYRFVQGGIIFIAMYVQSYQAMIRVKAKKIESE